MGIPQTASNCKYIIRFIAFFMVLNLMFASSQQAFAYDASLFVVENVKVDVTADDAVSAQGQAFEKAQKNAFEILTRRLVSDRDVQRMQSPDAGRIASMIKDYEVNNEQISAVRYVGDYTFRFDPKAASSYFSITGVQYTDTKSKPLLVLPILQIDGENVMWGARNLWLRNWARAQFPTALVPVEVPIGDLDDVADINDDNALRFERKSLDRMLLRYNAKEAAIMIALPDAELAQQKSQDIAAGGIRVSIYRTDRGRAEYVSDFRLRPAQSETVDQLYERAVLHGFRELQRNWKTRTAASAAQSRSYYVRMPLSRLEDLIEAKKILHTLPGLSDVSVTALQSVEVRLLLTFRGEESRLREALRSGSPFLLSQPYQKDRDTQTATASQQSDMNVMYDLYHRNKARRARPSSYRRRPAATQSPPTQNVHTF